MPKKLAKSGFNQPEFNNMEDITLPDNLAPVMAAEKENSGVVPAALPHLTQAPIDGRSLLADTTAFNNAECPAQLAVKKDGATNALIDLPAINFSFKSFFKDFEREITFSGKLKMGYEPLITVKNFLKITDNIFLMGSVNVKDQSLSQLLNPTAFSLESATEFYLPLFDGVTLTKAKFQLQGYEHIDMIRMKKDWELAMGIWGSLQISSLQTQKPIELDVQIGYNNKTLTASAVAEDIEGIFGIKGLVIDELQAYFSYGQQMDMELTAYWHSSIGYMGLGGKLTKEYGAMFGLVEDFSINSLLDLFNEITELDLAIPEVDIVFEKVLIGIASKDANIGDVSLEKGLTIQCDLKVHDFSCRAKGNISTDGIAFTGSLGNIVFEKITIQEAKLHIQLYTEASGKPCEVAVMGKAVIEGITVSCKLAFEKLGNKWTIIAYGAIDAKTFGLSNLFPETKDTFVDSIKFSKLAFIIATADCTTSDPDYPFAVRKGLQLMAVVSELPGISALTNKAPIGLEFCAYFGTRIDMSISMPETKLALGPNIVCTPFKIVLALVPRPAVHLIFGVDILNINANPLHFDMALAMDFIGATGSATLKGWIVEPFGIQGLKIGPDLAFQLGIDYVPFANTGMPSQLGLAGGLAIGKASANMAVNVTADPSRLILMGEMEKLTPENLVEGLEEMFALVIPKEDIPDFLDIHQVKIYIAPNGGNIGTINYEQGFSFTGNITFLEKNAAIQATVSKAGLMAKGQLDYIELGPLTIKGKHGSNLMYDFELSPSQQAIVMDGEIDLFSSNISILANISKKGILFDFDLNFIGLLTAKVYAKSKGSLLNPQNLGFELQGSFNNQLTEYLVNEISNRLTDVSKKIGADINFALSEVNKVKAQFNADLDKANAELQNAEMQAKQVLEGLQQAVRQQAQVNQQNIDDARQKVYEAERIFNEGIADAEAKVAQAQAEYDNAMRHAQQEVANAEAAYNNAMGHAQQQVNAAEQHYNNEFGRAQADLQNALNNVNRLQSEINGTQYEIDTLDFWNKWRLVYLVPKITGLWIAMNTAKLALQAIQGIVETFRNASSFVAFQTARTALEATRHGVNFVAFENARSTLNIVQTTGQKAGLDVARWSLEAFRTGTQFMVWKTAQDSLTFAEQEGARLMARVQDDLNNFGNTAIHAANQLASAAVEAVRVGGSSVALQVARDTLHAVQFGNQTLLEVSKLVLSQTTGTVLIRQINFGADMDQIKQGKLFNASIDMVILQQPFAATIALDFNNAKKFVDDLFSYALERLKELAVTVGK
jgi:hypothetical protein